MELISTTIKASGIVIHTAEITQKELEHLEVLGLKELQVMFDFGAGLVPAHQHSRGGGWVADTAQVAGNARVSGTARVFGNAQVAGNAQVYDTAWVFGNAQVAGNAQVSGTTRVSGTARVFGDVEAPQ